MVWPKGVSRKERTEQRMQEARIRQDESTLRSDPLPEDADEVEALMTNDILQNSLPNPPKRDGWHFFWASTTNTWTPIQMYIRLGFKFVLPEEVPEMSTMKAHSATFSTDVVQCNEMILMKTPIERWRRIMKKWHHDDPKSEAERLKVNVELLKRDVGADSQGNPLVREEGDGISSLTDTPRTDRRIVHPFEE
jgi:hypothetical protein